MEQGQGKDREIQLLLQSILTIVLQDQGNNSNWIKKGKWLTTTREDLRRISRYDGRHYQKRNLENTKERIKVQNF